MSSDSRYSYDDTGEVWPYFTATILGVVIVPLTISSVRQVMHQSNTVGRAGYAGFEKEDSFRLKSLRRKGLFSKRNLFLAAGWAFMAFLIEVMRNQKTSEAQATFDPYSILGVAYTVTEKEVKSVYRKLSLQFHPDKVKVLGNMTREMIEERYVDITKAYKALTDEVTRENFLKYGHPDGPQQTSQGVALPKFLVEGSASPLVIGSYAIVMGLVIPMIVSSWWTGVQTYTRSGIHQDTAAQFFEVIAKRQPHFVTYDNILDMMSKAAEFKSLLPNRTPTKIKQLLEDYLQRKEPSTEKDKMDQMVIASRCITLLEGLMDISSAFKSAVLCQRITEVMRCVIQAVPMESAGVGAELQLTTTRDLASFTSESQSKSQSSKVPSKASEIPRLHFVSAHFKVPGESVVPPSSQAHLIVNFTTTPSNIKEAPKLDSELVKSLEDDDFDFEADPKLLRNPLYTNDLPPLMPYAHAPFYPALAQPMWYVYLVNDRDNKIIEGPVEMKRVDLRNLRLSRAQLEKGDDVVVSTFKVQLGSASPPFEGDFPFRLVFSSSAYFGCDISEIVNMKVQNPPPEPAPEVIEDEEIEEGSQAAASADAAAAAVEGESSDDEDDLSDIDSDTDDEEDTKKKK